MSWSGVKKQSHDQEIKSWCEEMSIKKYNINSQGEIDVDGCVEFEFKENNDFKELPYKFGTVKGYFSLDGCRNLISLKNCPTKTENSFYCNDCPQLDSLEGCPKEVSSDFYCYNCKQKFTKKEVKSLCKVKGYIIN